MSDLKSMMKLQARLHKKQGAESLGLLFDSALSEIETLEVRAEAAERERDEIQTSYDSLAEDYADTRHSLALLEINRVTEKEMDEFAIEQQIKALEHEASLWPDDLTECSHVKSSILGSAEKLRQQLNGDDQ